MYDLRDIRSQETLTERNRIDDVLESIWTTLFFTWGKIARLDEEVYPVYERFTNLLRRCVQFDKTGVFTVEDVAHLKQNLQEAEKEFMRDGYFILPGKDRKANGQEILMSIFHRIRKRLWAPKMSSYRS